MINKVSIFIYKYIDFVVKIIYPIFNLYSKLNINSTKLIQNIK